MAIQNQEITLNVSHAYIELNLNRAMAVSEHFYKSLHMRFKFDAIFFCSIF